MSVTEPPNSFDASQQQPRLPESLLLPPRPFIVQGGQAAPQFAAAPAHVRGATVPGPATGAGLTPEQQKLLSLTSQLGHLGLEPLAPLGSW